MPDLEDVTPDPSTDTDAVATETKPLETDAAQDDPGSADPGETGGGETTGEPDDGDDPNAPRIPRARLNEQREQFEAKLLATGQYVRDADGKVVEKPAETTETAPTVEDTLPPPPTRTPEMVTAVHEFFAVDVAEMAEDTRWQEAARAEDLDPAEMQRNDWVQLRKGLAQRDAADMRAEEAAYREMRAWRDGLKETDALKEYAAVDPAIVPAVQKHIDTNITYLRKEGGSEQYIKSQLPTLEALAIRANLPAIVAAAVKAKGGERKDNRREVEIQRANTPASNGNGTTAEDKVRALSAADFQYVD